MAQVTSGFFTGWHDVVVPMGRAKFANGRVSQPDMAPDMLAWLHEHVGRTNRSTWVQTVDKEGRHIRFKDPQKALLFKLTWA